MMISSRVLLTGLKYLWLGAVLIGFLWYASQKLDDVSLLLHQLKLWQICGALAAICASKFFLILNQSLSQRVYTAPLSLAQNFRIYSLTQLSKYLPGSVWQFMSKAHFYQQAGLKLLTISFIMSPGQTSFSQFFQFIAASTFSFFSGYIAIFAPGGIGIREGILAWTLQAHFSENLILLASAQRGLMVIIEGVMFLASAFLPLPSKPPSRKMSEQK